MDDQDPNYRQAEMQAEVTPISDVDLQTLTFDGQKVDVYINTNRLGGKHFLVKVKDASGNPTLIAIHL